MLTAFNIIIPKLENLLTGAVEGGSIIDNPNVFTFIK